MIVLLLVDPVLKTFSLQGVFPEIMRGLDAREIPDANPMVRAREFGRGAFDFGNVSGVSLAFQFLQEMPGLAITFINRNLHHKFAAGSKVSLRSLVGMEGRRGFPL